MQHAIILAVAVPADSSKQYTRAGGVNLSNMPATRRKRKAKKTHKVSAGTRHIFIKN